jgi:hypothetical protein
MSLEKGPLFGAAFFSFVQLRPKSILVLTDYIITILHAPGASE